jgi:hypothetical protein
MSNVSRKIVHREIQKKTICFSNVCEKITPFVNLSSVKSNQFKSYQVNIYMILYIDCDIQNSLKLTVRLKY